MNWKNKAALLIVGWIAILGCARNPADEDEPESPPANVQVSVIRVQKGLIRQTIRTTGTLSALPDQDVKVSALLPGRVESLFVQEGDAVSKSAVLAKLDSSTIQNQLKDAQATLESAKANEERTTKLFERGIAAGKEKEDAHREFLIAQSAYDTARIQFSRTEIRSPIAGVVIKRFVNVGEQVDGTAGQPILEIANYDPLELPGIVPASSLPAIREGQTVEVRTDASGDSPFIGKVRAVLPVIDTATNAGTVRIRIPNADHRLSGGMFVTALIISGEHPAALLVPPTAIVSHDDEAFVIRVKPDSTVEERAIKIGWRDRDRVEVLDGVKEGDTVVTTGSYGLSDGMKVTVAESKDHS